MGSGGFRLFPQQPAWEGNVRLYAYHHPGAEAGWGYGFSMDQSVAGRLRVFARANTNASRLGDAFGIDAAWSAGASLIGALGGRQAVLGMAYGETDPAEQALRSEQTFEAYTRYQLNRWTYLSPHVQWVNHTGGSTGRITLLGLRAQFNF